VETPETRYAKTVDDVHIAYEVFGEGPVDLVSTNGMVSHVGGDLTTDTLCMSEKGLRPKIHCSRT
jgi:hypothetical protein